LELIKELYYDARPNKSQDLHVSRLTCPWHLSQKSASTGRYRASCHAYGHNKRYTLYLYSQQSNALRFTSCVFMDFVWFL